MISLNFHLQLLIIDREKGNFSMKKDYFTSNISSCQGNSYFYILIDNNFISFISLGIVVIYHCIFLGILVAFEIINHTVTFSFEYFLVWIFQFHSIMAVLLRNISSAQCGFQPDINIYPKLQLQGGNSYCLHRRKDSYNIETEYVIIYFTFYLSTLNLNISLQK